MRLNIWTGFQSTLWYYLLKHSNNNNNHSNIILSPYTYSLWVLYCLLYRNTFQNSQDTGLAKVCISQKWWRYKEHDRVISESRNTYGKRMFLIYLFFYKYWDPMQIPDPNVIKKRDKDNNSQLYYSNAD